MWDVDNANNWNISSLKTFLNGDYLNSIDSTSYQYIDLNHSWNLGSVTNDNSLWTRLSLYNLERGIVLASTEGSEATWEGAKNSWLCNDDNKWQWTMMLSSDSASLVLYVGYGNVFGAFVNSEFCFVSSTLYLKSNVKIVDGLGT